MRKFYLTTLFAMLFVLNSSSANSINSPSNSNSLVVPLGEPEFLYFHCDGGNRLYKMRKSTEVITEIGVTSGYPNIETITYNGFDDNLYGINSGHFVQIDKLNASVSGAVDIDGGTALQGSVGAVMASDVDALAFDPWTGDYWAAARRGGTFDALFKIDATTKQVIRNAFGAGIDYIIIDGVGVNRDIDDIAIDPTTGKLYAVTTVSGSSKLVEVNRFTGSIISSVNMDEPDAEGMDFSSDGVLYATIGTANELWIVALDGSMSDVVDLYDGGSCTDVESITATTAPADTIGGKVWEDTDMSGGINGGETGIAGVTVQLYYDNNGNGQIDTDDALLQTAVTDANGDYGFQFATNANLLVDIDETTLPTAYGMTTDNIETASFVDVNNVEQDYNNDFGAVSGADCDSDGIPDFVEGNNDSDNDGINDDCDLDSDNDGILDSVEGMVDTDNDGIYDLVDLDSDNDGIPDAIEANSGIPPAGYDPALGKIVGNDGDDDGLLDLVDDLPATSYGASASLIPNIDHDKDGIIDYVDLDSDNDGILDVIEAGGTDTDNDGMQDSFNDTNTDGYSDALTTTPLPIGDLDQSGSPNYLDLDADDDGILDNTEGQNASAYTYPAVFLDNDNDGIIDFWDTDFGGSPVNPINTDGTGNDDYLDIDADDDGIPDIVEAGGTDTDGDGHVDYPTPGDPTTMVDLDGDGLADTYDDEDTVGGTSGWVNGTPILNPDTDADGINDALDIDADNDGIPDIIEAGGTDINGDGLVDTPTDSDNDGLVDTYDPSNEDSPGTNEGTEHFVTGADSGDGTPSSPCADCDSDLDGNPDHLDIDADNDGIADIIEAGGTDTDGDGLVDNPTDSDNDGLVDTYDPSNEDAPGNNEGTEHFVTGADSGDGTPTIMCADCDSDLDGNPDHLDLDADNDGIPDIIEAGGTDTDGNGLVDNPTDSDNDGLVDTYDPSNESDPGTDEGTEHFTTGPDSGDGTPTIMCADCDSDLDGNPDHLDIDADNDGIADIIEAGGTDTDGDGLVDNPTDSDNDGLVDTYDPSNEASPGNNEGTEHFVTGADTGDGTPTSLCTDCDSDLDGNPDHLDLDADNDGIPDIIEAGGTDTDGDGLVDVVTDSDNDGLVDTYDPSNETAPGSNEGTEHFVTGADSGDGTPTIPCADCDSDKDGNPDHLDLDADNDGLPDIVEAGGIDTDGDGQVDVATDSDNDGYADVADPSNESNPGNNEGTEYFVTGADSGDGTPTIMCADCDQDSDGNPDHLDLDADNDGIPDVIEAGGIDTNGDGQVDTNTDTDNDGLADVYDTDDNTNPGTGDGGVALVATDGSGNMIDGATSASIDTDSDGFPDHLDIDADNDGITDIAEVGGDDPNGTGMVDTGLIPWDVDGDGLTDAYDTDNNTTPGTGDGASDALVITSADSGTNGHVDGTDEMQAGGASAFTTINEDSADEVGGIPSLPNQLDIDADNDGIVDNTEAQATNAYIAPTGYDDDNDGLDNAYDPDCTGTCTNSDGVTTDVTGVPMVLENTDMADTPDWIDTDTDNDGISDIDEAGAGVDPLATPEDLDGDGLIWDDATPLAVSPDDPTNTNDQPSTFDDVEDPGTDRDWRHGPCALCKVIYGVQDGAGAQTSAFNYDETTQMLESTTDVFGTIRTNKYCLIDGWRYYYNPANPTQALFAVRGDSLDLDKIDYIDITVGETASDREAGIVSDAYSRLMNRDWYVEMTSALTNPVDIRFYLPGDDFGTNGFQAADTEADNYALTQTPDYKWFQVPAWDVFDPTTIDADATNLTGMAGFEELSPVVDASTSTGLAETDGDGTTVGDGKNFVQFDGLTTLGGGTAGYGVGASALPVELKSFQAIVEGCSIDLNWITEGEINFSHYEVQWSGDGRSFQKLTTVKGSGTTSMQSYSFSDDNGADDNYYRLKMIDLDGSYSYSRVVHASTDCLESFKLKLYPNPVLQEEGQLSVKFFAQKETTSIVISDMFGRAVRSVELNASNREWSKSILDLSDLSPGTYNLRVIGQRRSQIFIISN